MAATETGGGADAPSHEGRGNDCPPQGMDPDEERVREEILKRLEAEPENYLAEYAKRFGNVLNADDAATLFDEYNQNPAKYRVAVHPAATRIRDELLRRAMAAKAPEGKNRVVFTAGSNAAGKSTAISFTKERSRAQVIFDFTFSNPEHAGRLVDQVLAADKRVTILYINRPLEDAFRGMLERARQQGRVVTIDTNTIRASNSGLLTISEKCPG